MSKTPKVSKPEKQKKSAKGAVAPRSKEPQHAVRSVVAEIVEAPDSEALAPVENAEEIAVPADFDISEIPAPKTTSKSVTTTDPIQSYLAEIRKYPLLSREQEQELAKRYYESKDPEAAQALVTANLRFVVKIAMEYSKFGARLIDLVQEGNMGLMHAVRDFNPYKGVRLITYAVWWIRGYIQEYLMKQYSLVKIGTTHNQKKLFYQLQKEKRELEALGENPDIQLIATRLGMPVDEVQEMSARMSGRDVSLDQPTDPDSTSSLRDLQRATTAGPDEELGRMEELRMLNKKIEELRPQLNERETILLEERILADDPLTLQEIGEKYGITREAVRQAETRLMKKITELFKNNLGEK